MSRLQIHHCCTNGSRLSKALHMLKILLIVANAIRMPDTVHRHFGRIHRMLWIWLMFGCSAAHTLMMLQWIASKSRRTGDWFAADSMACSLVWMWSMQPFVPIDTIAMPAQIANVDYVLLPNIQLGFEHIFPWTYWTMLDYGFHPIGVDFSPVEYERNISIFISIQIQHKLKSSLCIFRLP